MAKTIGYPGCSAETKVLVHIQDDDGPPAGRIEPATEHDLWRAGYVRIDLVHRLTTALQSEECENPDLDTCRCSWHLAVAMDDALCEGPPADGDEAGDDWATAFTCPEGYLPAAE